MNEIEIKETFLKSCNILNDTAKGIVEITKKIDKIHSDLNDLDGDEISNEIDEVIEEFLNSLTTAADVIEVLDYRLKDLERFSKIVNDMDINIDKIENIGEMIKIADDTVTQMVTETTKWKNKGVKMKSYEDKKRGLKKAIDALEFDEGASLGLQSKKINDAIKYLEEKIRYNKSILAAME